MSTLIEWVLNPDNKTRGETVNPLTGCYGIDGKGPCVYCYARTLCNGRLKPEILANPQCIGDKSDPFAPRWWKDRLHEVYKKKRPTGYFLCSLSDWLGDWVPLFWQMEIFDYINICNWHRFYVLTKQYANLRRFWPDNARIGGTVNTNGMMTLLLTNIASVEAKYKFISFEPLLGSIGMKDHMKMKDAGISWVIIGALTGSKNKCIELQKVYPSLTLTELPGTNKYSLQPRLEWVEEIIVAAKEQGVKVWLKDSLQPLVGDNMVKMKEMP